MGRRVPQAGFCQVFGGGPETVQGWPGGVPRGGGGPGALDAVTEGERITPLGARKMESGQNEAPDHGGTTGGFASDGRLRRPHIENVRPVRLPGQAELRHWGKFLCEPLHAVSTPPTDRHRM